MHRRRAAFDLVRSGHGRHSEILEWNVHSVCRLVFGVPYSYVELSGLIKGIRDFGDASTIADLKSNRYIRNASATLTSSRLLIIPDEVLAITVKLMRMIIGIRRP